MISVYPIPPPDYILICLEVSTCKGLNYGLYFASRVYPYTSIVVRTGFEPVSQIGSTF
jgi:hypothetical protein